MKPNPELDTFKDALWDYVLEHCDITERGTLFVKFHTKGKSVFIGHVNARAKGYHREDPHTKEQVAKEKRQAAAALQQEKEARWDKERERRKVLRREMRKAKMINTARAWLRKLHLYG